MKQFLYIQLFFLFQALFFYIPLSANGDFEEWRKDDSSKGRQPNIVANTELKEEDKKEKAEEIEKRLKNFQDRGMNYAKKLFMLQDGSDTDELRLKKSDALGYELRKETIEKTQTMLGKAKEPNMIAILKRRLAELYEKQANSEQILFAGTPKYSLFRESLKKCIELRLELIRKYHAYITIDIIEFSVAENYMALEDFKNAEKHYLSTTKYPKGIFISDAFLALGNLRFTQKKFVEARKFYAKILEINNTPLHAYAHYKIAWAYFNEGNEEMANAELIEAIKKSRSMAKSSKKKLDVEEEAIRDLVLFYAESGDPKKSKDFFEGVVGKEEAKNMRYMLARRYYSHDKHKDAFYVATNLLRDEPNDIQTGQLLMITLSVSEKTRLRESSMSSARFLSQWSIRMKAKLDDKSTKWEQSELAELDMVMSDTEESLRRLCHRLHFDAQKLNQKDLWNYSKESYELYFKTYKEGQELAEMRYRYAALLFKLKYNVEAHQNIELLFTMIKPENPRFSEALKLRIQVIEQASPEQKKYLDDKKLIIAYDDFAKYLSKDPLAVEAQFKAATLAKKEEGPQKASARFRIIAEQFPKHSLRDSAVKESLATLLNAGLWNDLAKESASLISLVAKSEEEKGGKKLLEDGKINEEIYEGNALYKQLVNARNTALVKIAEDFENQKKYEEAEKAYIEFIAEKKNSSLRPMALLKLASMAEKKMQNFTSAIKYWDQVASEYPSSKEGILADLEKARIHEKILQPKNAIVHYIKFSEKGKSDLHRTALTNAAVTLESIGEWNKAADHFYALYEWLKNNKTKGKESLQAVEYSCRNRLLAASLENNPSIYARLYECSNILSQYQSGMDGVLWQVRAAWSLEKSEKSEAAIKIWESILRQKKQIAADDRLTTLLTIAKARLLAPALAYFKNINFDKSNENPDANIAKKTKALDNLEQAAIDVLKNGSVAQAQMARQVLYAAYMNFAETLENSATPKNLSDADKETLKKSFAEAATQMKAKAQEFTTVQEKVTTETVEKIKEKSYPSLGSKDYSEYIIRIVNQPHDVEVLAKLAWHMFDKEDYGVARYIALKWADALKKQDATKLDEKYNEKSYQDFWTQINLKIPMIDPVITELTQSRITKPTNLQASK